MPQKRSLMVASRKTGYVRGCHLFRAICCLAASTTVSGLKPNFLIRSLSGADAPKVCMPMTGPGHADVARPAEGRGLSTATRAVAGGGQHLVAVGLVWRSKSSQRGHADDAGLDAFRVELLVGVSAEGDLAAGADEDHVRLAVGGVGEDVGALGQAGGRARTCVRSRVGIAWRVRTRAIGGDGSWTLFQASMTSLASPGRTTIMPGIARRRDELLDRLVGRAVLADADANRA